MKGFGSQPPKDLPAGSSSKRQSKQLKTIQGNNAQEELAIAIEVHRKGDHAKAIKLYEQVLDQGFWHPACISNLALLYKYEKRFHEAERLFRRAISTKPDYAVGYSNLSNLLLQMLRFDEAESTAIRAIEIDKDLAEAHLNLGLAYKANNKLEAAVAELEKAAYYKPDCEIALLNLGRLYAEQEQPVQAISHFKKILDLTPESSEAKAWLMRTCCMICDWSGIQSWQNWLEDIGMMENKSAEPWTLMAIEDQPDRHLIRAKSFFNAWYRRREDYQAPIKTQKTKIRIGYFSADIYHHATMILLWPLIVRRDRHKFEFYLYDYAGTRVDRITEQTKKLVDIYRDIKKMGEEECTQLARNDELDIAIDLKGFTQSARLSLFARRVAPIQIGFLGYPGSMGVDCFDYLIADRMLIPQEEREHYSEEIIYMPYSYQPNDCARPTTDRPFKRSELDLPEEGFVFACFNANYKIQPKEFQIWMSLLKRVNSSVLWLYKSNDFAMANLKAKAEELGLSQDRLIFAEPMATQMHLARLRCADLFLDTFNVNAHTTASDALWAGLPVLTKPGRSFTARVGASLLNAIEMPELIAQDEQDYEAKAFYYATNPDAYQAMRQKLWDHRLTTPLFDSDGYVRAFEERMEQIVLNGSKKNKQEEI